MRSILYVVNDASFFLSHRLPLALASREGGYRVAVATAPGTGEERLEALGLEFHPFPMSRNGSAPLAELRTVLSLYRLFRKVRPDVVHLVTIKPNLYGSLAARLAGTPRVINAISGLGYIFIAQGARASARRRMVELAYRVAMRHPDRRVIFQNPDDRDAFLRAKLVAPQDVVMIRGSGVDAAQFSARPEPEGRPTVVLAARLLKDKGIVEFAEAARRLRAEGIDARFLLVGELDPGNPTSIQRAQLDRWLREGVLEWSGRRDDMPAVLAGAHVVCLPSYREGLSKALVEAAACGRAIVTCDVPGCRDVVEHGHNGLLVPPRDAAALASALRTLLTEPALRQRMGRAGRAKFEAEFSLDQVIAQTLRLYAPHPERAIDEAPARGPERASMRG